MERYTDNPEAVAGLFRGGEVHRDVYIDDEVYRLEMKHLFRNAWIFVGHDSQTPNKGDYFTTQVADQPVIMDRHSDGEGRTYPSGSTTGRSQRSGGVRRLGLRRRTSRSTDDDRGPGRPRLCGGAWR